MSEKEIQDIVSTFLAEGTSSSRPTCEKIVVLFDENEEGKDKDKDWVCEPLYRDILEVVKEGHHDDPRQEKLVTLLEDLKQTSSKEPWTTLSPLGMLVREIWNGGATEHGVDGWASLNAFAARLTTREVLDFDAYGIWAMRYSLEDGTVGKRAQVTGQVKEGELNPDVLDTQIPAAASWIFYAGQRMWNLGLQEREWPKMMQGGPSWHGPDGYSRERWQFWKERFAEFSKREDLKTSALAAEAHECMKKLEG